MTETEAKSRRSGTELRPGAYGLIFAGFSAICLVLYRGALHGPLIADDLVYIALNPYVHSMTPSSVMSLFVPGGPASVANYAPIHLLLHSIAWKLFGQQWIFHHAVNILIHALNATLLFALLNAAKLPMRWALLGGAFFALHPAQVEAVAWISQLKSDAALAFGLGAVLAFRSRPGLGAVLFGLGLLVKASATFALPMVAALWWSWGPSAERPSWRWLALWTAVLVVYSIPQFVSFQGIGDFPKAAYDDPRVHVASMAEIGARYLVMAATSVGVSAYHEVPPTRSLLAPWCLVAWVTGAVLVWRIAASLHRRTEEAAWWIAAAAGYAPVSQVVPFFFPMADRYLYFILPGLIGGTLLWAREFAESGAPRISEARRRSLGRLAQFALVPLIFVFGVQSGNRATLWLDERRLLVDAAAHYPDGGTAAFVRAALAAERGDVAEVVSALRAAAEKHYFLVRHLTKDPYLAPVFGTEEFKSLSYEINGRKIEFILASGLTRQVVLRELAAAHAERGEFDEAIEALDRGIRQGGLMSEVLLEEQQYVRQLRREAR